MSTSLLSDLNISADLRSWLVTKTLGGFSHKSFFQYYDKQLWMPIKNVLETIKERTNNSIDELELLSCCYTGELFRVQHYNERARAHVFPLGCYQSWCTEEGLDALSRIGGRVLLIRSHATSDDYAIDTIKLMAYLEPEIWGRLFSGTHELSRYVPECEVVMPIKKTNVDNMYVVEATRLTEWKSFGEPIKQEKWFRNNW